MMAEYLLAIGKILNFIGTEKLHQMKRNLLNFHIALAMWEIKTKENQDE